MEPDSSTTGAFKNRTNFIGVAAKSAKSCTKFRELADKSELVNCSEVSSHFYRNFLTDQPKEDIQFSLDDANKSTKIFGFFSDYKDDARTQPGAKANKIGEQKPWVGVYPAHKTNVATGAVIDTSVIEDTTNIGDSLKWAKDGTQLRLEVDEKLAVIATNKNAGQWMLDRKNIAGWFLKPGTLLDGCIDMSSKSVKNSSEDWWTL